MMPKPIRSKNSVNATVISARRLARSSLRGWSLGSSSNVGTVAGRPLSSAPLGLAHGAGSVRAVHQRDTRGDGPGRWVGQSLLVDTRSRRSYHLWVRLQDIVLEQLSRPRGALAPVTALVLNSLNARTILAGVSALELRAGQRVVEVGFGGGLSLPLLMRGVGARGHVFALETSDEMLARARRRFIIARLQGRLRVEKAWIESLPLGDASFEAALSINTISFWVDVDAAMRELARVLVPEGRLVLGVADPEGLERHGFAARGHRIVVPEQLSACLPRWGFEALEIRRTADKTALVIAHRIDDR